MSYHLKPAHKNYLAWLPSFNASQLKVLAMFSMLIDHVNKVLIGPYLTGQPGSLAYISSLFDILGRIAFPLFAFFIVEGFFKTHNRLKYLMRLLLFAAISEIPFDLFMSYQLWNPNANNVLWTFIIGFCLIWVSDCLVTAAKTPWRKVGAGIIIAILLVISCLIAMLASTDYEHFGVLIIFAFYLFYNQPWIASVVGLGVLYKEWWAFLGFLAVLSYNGERGQQNKWLAYCFYPAHLLIIGIVRQILGV